jgi:hypothetical protein
MDQETSLSHHQINETAFDRQSASQRRHAFSACKNNIRRSEDSAPSGLFPESPIYGLGATLSDELRPIPAGERLGHEHQDPTRLIVPGSSSFTRSGIRGNPYFRHHSYDVPTPPPQLHEDGA